MAFRRKIVKGKYTKVCSLTKKQFIYKVIMLKTTIRQAALELRINYSTAKSIIRLYKTEHLKMRDPLLPFDDSRLGLRQNLDEITNKTSSYRQNTYWLKLQSLETEPSELSSELKVCCSERELLTKNYQLIRSSNVTVIGGQFDLFL